MKTITGLLALTLCSLAIFSSCGNITAAPFPTLSSYLNTYYPLAMGNYWVYGPSSNTSDTTLIVQVTDTLRHGGQLYYKIVSTPVGAIKGEAPDTIEVRFSEDSLVVRFINGADSSFLDLGATTIVPTTIYPGVVSYFPYRDSTVLGIFDSCKVITFGGMEPASSVYARGIGEIERTSARLILTSAKLGDSSYVGH